MLGDLYSFDPATALWVLLDTAADAAAAAANAAAAVGDGTVAAADPPPAARAFHSLVAHGERLILFGGWLLAGPH